MAMLPDDELLTKLGELYAAEAGSLTGRLAQAYPFVRWDDAADDHALRAMAAENREHQAWLAALLIGLGGSPPPVRFPTDSAASHYLQPAALLPRLVGDERGLLAACQNGTAALSRAPEAARLIGQITQRHARHLEILLALEDKHRRAGA